jgi:2-polyprenyl-3-methyl-5-hydroxy-6-metoxy-1,4-benzoquinol methylase
MKFNDKYNNILLLHRSNPNRKQVFKNISDTFDLIKPYLDNNQIKNVLDIGCGLGLINIFIYNYFKCNLYLLDKSVIEENK